MILLLGVCVTVTLTYLFFLVLFPFHLSSCEQRERNEGASHSPLIREGWKRNMETRMGVFGAITKGSWHAWDGFIFFAALMYLFYETSMLNVVIMILD